MAHLCGLWPVKTNPGCRLPANKFKTDARTAIKPLQHPVRTVGILNNPPSGSAKDRWNSLNYQQVKVSVKPEIAAAFKTACTAANVSIASVLSKFMVEYSQNSQLAEQAQLGGANAVKPRFCRGCPKASPDASPFGTRRKRRTAVKAIISQLDQIASAEENYRDNIPENLQGSIVYDAADQSLSNIQEAIEILGDAF